VFGQVMHGALAGFLRSGEDAVQLFLDAWTEAKQLDLTFSARESWDGLHKIGQLLLEQFLRDEHRRLTAILTVEKPFRLTVTGLAVPFVGIIDLVAELDGKATVIDFKTANSRYEAHEVLLSDQLTAYQLAQPESVQTALCVLLKTKQPSIDWHKAAHHREHLSEYLGKVALVAHEIAARHFYRRPGKWCTWCDYLPVCTGDRRKAEETLTKVR
jgi:hypothetical protein